MGSSVLGLVLLTSLAMRPVAADTNSVRIDILSDDELTNWIDQSPIPAGAERAEPSCGRAKYEETSSCQNAVITNGSDETVAIEIQVSGSGFEDPPSGEIGRFDFGGRSRRPNVNLCSVALGPGASCYQPLAFSPRNSGVSIGRVEVRVSGKGTPVTRVYELAGVAEYPPDLEAADQVRKEYLDELMRISHVARVSLDDSGDDIAIDVEVAHEEDIPKVEREVPPRLGGYRVEVTQKLEESWGL